jgi:hypothetical protein
MPQAVELADAIAAGQVPQQHPPAGPAAGGGGAAARLPSGGSGGLGVAPAQGPVSARSLGGGGGGGAADLHPSIAGSRRSSGSAASPPRTAASAVRPGSPLRAASSALAAGAAPNTTGLTPPATAGGGIDRCSSSAAAAAQLAGDAASVEALAWLEAWSPAQRAEQRTRDEAEATAEAAAAAARAELELAADAQGDADAALTPTLGGSRPSTGQTAESETEQQQRLQRTLSATGGVCPPQSVSKARQPAVGGGQRPAAGEGGDAAWMGSLITGCPCMQPDARAATTGSGGRDPDQAAAALLLLAACGDGRVHVWMVDRLGGGRLLFTLPGAQGRLDVVSAARVSIGDDFFVTGDTGGHVRVWDVGGGVDAGNTAACKASFVQRAHWRAHGGAVAGLDFVQGGPVPLVITASRDSNVALWTMDGGLVGVLGEHLFDLSDPTTWSDPEGARTQPPAEPDQGVYMSEAAAAESAAAAEGRRVGGSRRATAGRQRHHTPPDKSSGWVGGMWAAGGSTPGGTPPAAAATTAASGPPAGSWEVPGGAFSSIAGGGGGTPPGRTTCEFFSDGIACAAAAAAEGQRDVGGVPLVQLMLQVGARSPILLVCLLCTCPVST